MDPCHLIPPDVEQFDDIYTNEYGSIRRKKVKWEYDKKNLTLSDIVSFYTNWRDDPEYFILRGTQLNSLDQERIIPAPIYSYDNWYLENEYDYIYKFIKASKRGNDVYKHLVSKKLKPLQDLYNIIFFDEHDVNKKTCALFVTLTYDNKKCSPDQAWKNIGSEFHLFKANLKKQYRNIEVFRTWESTNHYYPHVHALIIFEEHEFMVISHKDKDGNITYRIPYKEKQKIQKYWYSNIDIQALKDTKGGIQELTKYITKDLCSKKGNKTNAMIWIHRKQSYSISKRFITAMQGWYINFNEPTNLDLINQMCNLNRDVVKWEFLGILRGRDLGFFDAVWCLDLKKPPPRIMKMIENECLRWKRLHGSR